MELQGFEMSRQLNITSKKVASSGGLKALRCLHNGDITSYMVTSNGDLKLFRGLDREISHPIW